MYRAQMTDTELEAFQMEGEFKPITPRLDPAQMLDSELREAIKEYQDENTTKTDHRKTRVLAEYSRRFLRK